MRKTSKKNRLTSVLDVDSNFKYHFGLLFNRIANMFEFENIPSTVDVFYLKYLLYLTGKALFFKKGGAVYVGNANLGGEPNEYYMPKMAVFANPVLGSEDFTLGENAEMLFTSSADRLSCYSLPLANGAPLYGVCPTYELIHKTAELLSDCMTSINIVQKNARASFIVTAPTQAEKNGLDLVLDRIYSGEPFVSVIDSGALDNIKVLPLVSQSSSNTTLKELRETYQYYLSQFYHAIGVGSNANFKRERMTDDEVEVENEPLLINILDMENTLQEGIKRVNAMFGTNIEVKLSEHWQRLADNEEGESYDISTQDAERDSTNDGDTT